MISPILGVAPSGGTVDVGSRHDVYFTLLQPSTLKLSSRILSGKFLCPRNPTRLLISFFDQRTKSQPSQIDSPTVRLRNRSGQNFSSFNPFVFEDATLTAVFLAPFETTYTFKSFNRASGPSKKKKEKDIIVRSTEGWTYKAFASDVYRQALFMASTQHIESGTGLYFLPITILIQILTTSHTKLHQRPSPDTRIRF